MNNIKEPLKLGGILGAIALVLAVMLSYVNAITEDKIDLVNKQIIQEGLKAVQESADSFIPMDGTDLTNSFGVTVNNIFLAMDKAENVIGYCATVTPDGYAGTIETIVGIDMNGIVTGVEITSNMSETPGLGAKVQKKENFTYQFVGKPMPFSLKKDGGELDAITSATITSRAVTAGINAAVEVMCKNNIYGSYAEGGEIIDGKYVIPAAPKEEPEETETSENTDVSEEEPADE